MLNQDNLETLEQVDENEITGYCIHRSPTNRHLFNIFSHNAKGDLLAVVETDMEFEKAVAITEAVNQTFIKN